MLWCVSYFVRARIILLYASLGKNVSTYYGRDWNSILEKQARGHSRYFSCDNILNSLPSKPMFTIFNQASPEQLLTYCPKITFSHTLTVFDTRLSILFYVANNLAIPPFQTIPFPLYRTNLSMLAMLPKKNRLHGSIGTASHNKCRGRLYKVLAQSNHTFTLEKNKEWLERIRRSEFNIMCSGTFPATFMIYETILAAALPIFVISGSGKLRGRSKPQKRYKNVNYYSMMPFSDIGVDWMKFSIIIHEREFTPEFVQTVLKMETQQVRLMLEYLKRVQHYFIPVNAFKYAVNYHRSRPFSFKVG